MMVGAAAGSGSHACDQRVSACDYDWHINAASRNIGTGGSSGDQPCSRLLMTVGSSACHDSLVHAAPSTSWPKQCVTAKPAHAVCMCSDSSRWAYQGGEQLAGVDGSNGERRSHAKLAHCGQHSLACASGAEGAAHARHASQQQPCCHGVVAPDAFDGPACQQVARDL
jgi:hypothetical protein